MARSVELKATGIQKSSSTRPLMSCALVRPRVAVVRMSACTALSLRDVMAETGNSG